MAAHMQSNGCDGLQGGRVFHLPSTPVIVSLPDHAKHCGWCSLARARVRRDPRPSRRPPMASPPPPGFVGVVENPVAEEKGKFLNRAGCLTLVRAVLSSIPTYFLTVFNLQIWAIKQIDKIRRSFL